MPSLKELLNTESLKSGGSYLSDLADTIVNLPTNLQRVVTHPQIFNKIVGYNPLQRKTGFAAAATGLFPKQEYADEAERKSLIKKFGKEMFVVAPGMKMVYPEDEQKNR